MDIDQDLANATKVLEALQKKEQLAAVRAQVNALMQNQDKTQPAASSSYVVEGVSFDGLSYEKKEITGVSYDAGTATLKLTVAGLTEAVEGTLKEVSAVVAADFVIGKKLART